MKRLCPIIMMLIIIAGCGGAIKTVDIPLSPDLDFISPDPAGGGVRLTVIGDKTILLPMTGNARNFRPDADQLFREESGKLFARTRQALELGTDIESYLKRSINPGSTIVVHFLVPYAPSVNDDLKTLIELREECGPAKLTILGVYFVDMEREKKEADKVAEEAFAFSRQHPEIKIYQADLSVVKKLGSFEDYPHTIVISPNARIIGDYAGPIKKDKLKPLLGL